MLIWTTKQEHIIPYARNLHTQRCYCTTAHGLDAYGEDGSGITPHIERTLNHLRLLNVEIPQPDKIRDYLTYHSDMVYLLLEISEEARLKFRSETQLSLELNRDPEDYEYLILYVRQDNYDESVMKRIKQIREKYGSNLAYISGWFLITTDFCAPGNNR
jgi:hypothetical protein